MTHQNFDLLPQDVRDLLERLGMTDEMPELIIPADAAYFLGSDRQKVVYSDEPLVLPDGTELDMNTHGPFDEENDEVEPPALSLASSGARRPRGVADAIVKAAESRQYEDVRKDLISGKLTDSLACHRDETGKLCPERERLHRTIIAEFLDSHAAQENPQALFTAGAPLAGKKALIDNLPIPEDAVLIDPDEIRPLLPERDEISAKGRADIASLSLHEEISQLAKAVTTMAMNKRANVIIDSVGPSAREVDAAERAGYEITVRYADAPLEQTEERNIERFKRTGRLVAP